MTEEKKIPYVLRIPASLRKRLQARSQAEDRTQTVIVVRTLERELSDPQAGISEKKAANGTTKRTK